jgi:hypothetical protein
MVLRGTGGGGGTDEPVASQRAKNVRSAMSRGLPATTSTKR